MIIDIWMVVANVKKLGIAEKFAIYIATYIYIYMYIYIHVYIYIHYVSNLLMFLLNKVHYTIVYRVKV